MPYPSYYETDIDRARKRSQEMQKEMGGASQTATGALSAYQQLQAKLAEDEDSKQRLALEQAREDRIAAFGRGGSANSGKGKGSTPSTPSGLSPGQDVPDLTLGAPAPGAPMTVQEALNAKLTPGMSMLPKNAAAQVADVGDIMQKAGLNQESRTDAVPNTGDDVVDQGMASATPGALPSPDVRAALQRVEGSAQGDETMASPDVQKQAVDLDKEKAEAAKVAAQAKVAEKKAAPSTGGAAGPASAKQRLADAKAAEEELKLDAMKNGKPPPGSKAATSKGKTDPKVMDQRIKEAEELAQIYESGGLNETGSEMLNPEHHPIISAMFSSGDRNRARQLATGLALGVPSAFSGSTRLNNTEFLHSLQSIIGSPDTSMSNKNKAEMARSLANDLRSMKDELASPSAPAGAAQGDRVVVSNGTKTVSIPRARLTEAQADGFHEVGP